MAAEKKESFGSQDFLRNKFLSSTLVSLQRATKTSPQLKKGKVCQQGLSPPQSKEEMPPAQGLVRRKQRDG